MITAWVCSCLLLYVSSVVTFDHGSMLTPSDGVTEENHVSRNYINKYSSSWRSFAEANDITKREKLKKALKDALHSIDYKGKTEAFPGDAFAATAEGSNTVPVESRSTVERIKKAALLLKEFKQIHALSETVKRTLQTYNAAKKNLSQVVGSEDSLNLLKRFLVVRTKRSIISSVNKTVTANSTVNTTTDTGGAVLENLQIDKPHFIKHTPRVSLIATPINGSKAIGVEYISIDPKTSTVDRATSALRAAKILLKYAGEKRKSKAEHIDTWIDSMRKDLDGMHGGETSREYESDEMKKKSLFPNKANLYLSKDEPIVKQQGSSHVKTTQSERDTLLESVVNTKYKESKLDEKNFPVPAETSTVTEESKRGKLNFTTDVDEPDSNKLTHTTNTTRNNIASANQLQQKNSTALLEKIKYELHAAEKIAASHSKNDLTGNRKITTNKNNIENGSTSTGGDSHAPLKHEETLRILKEAKLARQKYELARHELAQKVKELYNMANQYEKEETENQVLEVKNNVVPRLHPYTPNEDTHGVQSKRDDAHPGIALSGVSNHAVKGIHTSEPNDGTHKGFTMGAIDRKEHQINLNSVGLPNNLKAEELPDELGKHMKSQEETLKVVAQAIKEDLHGITNTDKKKKMLAAAMANTGEKKNSQANEKIDEYLTKALADIMGNDSVPASEAGKEAEEKQKEEQNKHEMAIQENMRIVEEAMKTHAQHPDLPLPLVSTTGDKMVLNKDSSKAKDNDPQNRNGVGQTNEHTAVPPLNIEDPSSKALLDQASHMEEQVAAQQDQLYNKERSESKTPPDAKPNIDPSPAGQAPPQIVHSNGRHDPYGSIKETHDNSNSPPQEAEGNGQETSDEDEEENDDEDEEDDEADRRHHHPHSYDDDDYDDDEDDDDDEGYEDEDADKRGRVRHHDERARKRSFTSVLPGVVSTSSSVSAQTEKSTNTPAADDKPREELMDVKKSNVPVVTKETVIKEEDFPEPMYPEKIP